MARTARTSRLIALLTTAICLLVASSALAEPTGSRFRVSTMGADANALLDANAPSVAYSAIGGRYLVVWYGDNDAADGFEIWGRLYNPDGTPASDQTLISDTTPAGTARNAFDPDVVANPTNDEFLVVWDSDDDVAARQDGEEEIYGRIVDSAPDAASNDLTFISSQINVSNVGGSNEAIMDAFNPAAAVNSVTGEYFVVWNGDHTPATDGNYEIWGQHLNANGVAIGGAALDDFRISTNGNVSTFSVADPDVAFSAVSNEYLVVWEGDRTNTDAGDYEIYGQRVMAGGGEIGGDVRLSQMGDDSTVLFNAFAPAIAWDSARNEHMVVWWGDDNTIGDSQFEIFGQRVAPDTTSNGDRLRISDLGPVDPDFDAFDPAIAYAADLDQFFVAFDGDDTTNGRLEVFGQAVAGGGSEVGTNDFLISDMQPNCATDPATCTIPSAFVPAVAYDSAQDRFVSVWEGDETVNGLVSGEDEIWGRLVSPFVAPAPPPPPPPPADPPPPPPPPPPGDRDADGITDDKDKCPDVKRGEADRDNDGCPGPFPRLRTTVTLTATLRSGVFSIKTLTVRVPSKSKVVVSCKKGCRRKKQTLTSKTLSFKKFVRNLRVKKGAVIEVRATRRNFNGTFVSYTFTSSSFKKRELCIPYGKTRPVKRCP